MGTIRLAFRILWLVALIALCVPFHLLRGLLGIRSPWPKRFLGWCASAVGLRVTVVGQPAAGPTLFAANHQSWSDILLIGGATGASFVAADGVRRWPVAGWLATMVGTIYVNRAERREAGAQAARIREAMLGGKSVAFFPEGGLNGGTLMPFKSALFGAVLPPFEGAAVQPIAIDYGAATAELTWPRGTHAGKHAMDVMRRPGRTPVTVRILDPIVLTPETDRRELAERAHSAIGAALGGLIAPASPQ